METTRNCALLGLLRSMQWNETWLICQACSAGRTVVSGFTQPDTINQFCFVFSSVAYYFYHLCFCMPVFCAFDVEFCFAWCSVDVYVTCQSPTCNQSVANLRGRGSRMHVDCLYNAVAGVTATELFICGDRRSENFDIYTETEACPEVISSL